MADAIVIGGGVMGLASARALAQRNYSVTLLERGRTGRAASWASAGIVGATSRQESDPSFHLRRVSSALWPAFAEGVQAESGMDPEYRQMGCLHLASSDAELGVLAAQVRTRVLRTPRTRGALGTSPPGPLSSRGEGVEVHREEVHAEEVHREEGHGDTSEPRLLDGSELRALEPALGPRVLGGLLVAGGNVDNRRLCRALEIAARRAGVRIETGAEVKSVTTAGSRVTGVVTATRSLRADLVVLAAGAWSATIGNVRPVPPVAPQKGQIFALDQSSVGISHVLLTPGDPYFVPRCDGRLVIGATREEAGWDPSLTAGGVAWLLNRAIEVVPALKNCPIAEMWTGFRPASADGLPLIGRAEFEGLYFLTGHGPSGIAPLPGSVALLMALITGEEPPVSPEPFDPLRFARSD